MSLVSVIDENTPAGPVVDRLNDAALELLDRNFPTEVVVVSRTQRLADLFRDEWNAAAHQAESMLGNVPLQIVVPGEWRSRDQSTIRGLSYVNGDCALIISEGFDASRDSVSRVVQSIQGGSDVSVVRADFTSGRLAGMRSRAVVRVFNWLCGTTFSLQDSRFIGLSRRAINWALAVRANSHWLPEVYLFSPLNVSFLDCRGDTDHLVHNSRVRLSDVWPTLVRHSGAATIVLRTLVSCVAIVVATIVVNSIWVSTTGTNLLGQPEPYIPGWTTLVVLTGLGLLATNIGLLVVIKAVQAALDGGHGLTPFISVSGTRPE